jgi:hypothetical protein
MAKRKKSGSKRGLVVIRDKQGNIYMNELGEPVTDSLSKADKDALNKRFDAFKKSRDGQKGGADAIIVDPADGTNRILERGTHLGQSSTDPDGKKKKNS